MPNLEALSAMCSVLQIVGLAMLVGWKYLPQCKASLLSVCGFAAVVKVFLPLEAHQSVLNMGATVAGIGLILFACGIATSMQNDKS